jgi:enoyl-CoA hydratase/carnithine racemase
MQYEQILVEHHGPVRLVTLNRPERMNAWTWKMSAEMGHAFGEADDDDDVRVIVVTGKDAAFCAGADLSDGAATFTGRSRAVGLEDDVHAARAYKSPRKLRTPIIAAINGAAVGAGLTMTMGWDLRVAADNAKLGFVFNRRGVMPDADLIWAIPRMIGFGPAMDVLMTGRVFNGTEAKELGLVNRVVPREQVLETAMSMARDIAANTGPVSVAVTKRLMYDFLDKGWQESAQLQRELFAWTGNQPDAREGVVAFLERRPPQWSLSKTRDLPEQLPE